MSRSGAIGGRVSAFTLMLACMAIALRVLIPQGYMVAPSAPSGSVPIMLCTAQGVRTVNIDATGHIVDAPAEAPADSNGGPPSDGHCAFSGLGAAFMAEAPRLIALAVWRPANVAIILAPQTTPGRGLAAPPPPPTGPPLQI